MAEIAGNLSPNNADFLPQFKAIGQGLRKRFFRKPNVAEAIEQYEELAQELQREGQIEFSALCYVEAAKCHEPLKNPIQQANALLKSGRLYLSARNQRRFYQDNSNNIFYKPESLQSAISGNTQLAVQCLSQAAKIYKRENFQGLSVLITLEIASCLYSEGCFGEAAKYYRSALDTCKTHFTFIDQVQISEYMIECKLEVTDYDTALKLINDALVSLRNANTEEEVSPEFQAKFLNRLEIYKVCLLMLLGTNSKDVLGSIFPECAKQSSSASSDVTPKPASNSSKTKFKEENIALELEMQSVQTHLKSLVIAVQHGNEEEIENVRSSLAPGMNQCHHNLFGMLVKGLS